MNVDRKEREHQRQVKQEERRRRREERRQAKKRPPATAADESVPKFLSPGNSTIRDGGLCRMDGRRAGAS